MRNTGICLFAAVLGLAACSPVKHTTSQPVAVPAAAPVIENADQQQASSYRQTEVKFSDQSTWLLGYFSPDRLKQEPYSEFYYKGFDNYVPGSGALNQLLEIPVEGITIKVVMGTWCPDSRREVPRFMKIMQLWQFPVQSMTFIGVDNAKLSPVGEYEQLAIQRVPTFIIYKNNIEIGRIIENPVTSLEQDMVNILTGKGK